MTEVCCENVSESSESSPRCKASSQAARQRRIELRRVRFVSDVSETENGLKRKRLELYPAVFSRKCSNAEEDTASDGEMSSVETETGKSGSKEIILKDAPSSSAVLPKFGVVSLCGRRRDMEDAVAVHPSFCSVVDDGSTAKLHYFGVYDGHGCSHVATKCKDRLHDIVKEELEITAGRLTDWKKSMERSFSRLETEVTACSEDVLGASCRCELQAPESDAVGSTAVVSVVTPDKIIVANCGDSRAVLCRNGAAVPLSTDHKPDRPDELDRIETAGGRVIFWDVPRVLGMLAMSRAIGDNYLKPYVSCEPEVTITDRSDEDECLILASDGLWDVVSNKTACDVARMCLKGKVPSATSSLGSDNAGFENSDKACADASMLLTKLALARRSSDNVSVVVIDLRKHV
ncbi:hypothetical protein RJ639_003500 [Escallonia herrerae]|uniref:protein-serine/threonine phosphatase n=1 Tax=Escallonia herrerae TaxID=1293975 RepID=A0AA89B183_9ASTE|nr:hypothetical protein RJ639_003500 [Escallonia herrerae]